MPFIEAPTTFYLGKSFNPATRRLDDDIVYYDSRDLMTHAVVVGMTGSGKTGLCINMLEEAVLDNIPAIVIDPKGDITNLLLTFPNLHPQDFRPWINPDEARRNGMDEDSYAEDVAQRWRDGLASWGIVPDRLRWLSMATQYSIYTPGSDAGLPISILASLRAPRQGWSGNEEALREKINGITTALLALIGKDSKSVDKEHVLIANIFENAWIQGVDLTLEDIILQIQKPPFEKLGVFPIDKYISEKARFNLSMELNSIIAAPSFQSWLQGQPIDITALMRQPNGRPRVSVFYIAHLSEQERQFIITLLLENLLSWMRQQSGTTSLRALLYIDEMFGYFPPYPKNPPTKEPILRLLKQARAFGVGLILATQNPGDLDYKGLTNAGTWFIGRLQSENDLKKVMAGLQQLASAEEDLHLDDVEQIIADITPRVFLMRNVHNSSGPILLHTRWAMNYLAGPLTRHQIGYLMQGQRQRLMQMVAYQQPPSVPGMPPPPQYSPGQSQPLPAPGMAGVAQFAAHTAPQVVPQRQGWAQQHHINPPGSALSASQVMKPTDGLPAGYSTNLPPVSSSVAQYFLPAHISSQQALANWQRETGHSAGNAGGGTLVYDPMLVAQAVVRYQEKKANLYVARVYAYLIPDLGRAGLVHWEDYFTDPLDARNLDTEPFGSAAFGDLAPGLSDSSRLTQVKREIVDMLYNTARLPIPFNPELKIYGNPDEDFGEFQAAVEQAAREKRDIDVDKLTSKYGAMIDKLEDKRRKEERELRAEKKELRDRKREELYTTGEALHGLWKGRTAFTVSRMSRATRYRRQTKEDIHESEMVLDEIQQQMGDVEEEFEHALQQINQKWAEIVSNTREHTISPYKKDIQLELFGIGWIPRWYLRLGGQDLFLDAY